MHSTGLSWTTNLNERLADEVVGDFNARGTFRDVILPLADIVGSAA